MSDPENAFTAHDHAACQARVLEAAEEKAPRMTPLRQKVLDALLASHHALSAYEILDRITEDGEPAQPPRVYRALSYLGEAGLVHRIERLNAFVACTRPSQTHSPALLICRSCRLVSETSVAGNVGELAAAAEKVGFLVEQTVVEAEGLCPACQDAA